MSAKGSVPKSVDKIAKGSAPKSGEKSDQESLSKSVEVATGSRPSANSQQVSSQPIQASTTVAPKSASFTTKGKDDTNSHMATAAHPVSKASSKSIEQKTVDTLFDSVGKKASNPSKTAHSSGKTSTSATPSVSPVPASPAEADHDLTIFRPYLQLLYSMTARDGKPYHSPSRLNDEIDPKFHFKALGFKKMKHLVDSMSDDGLVRLANHSGMPSDEYLSLSVAGYCFLLLHQGGHDDSVNADLLIIS
jgi:hypothetical protein